MLSDRDFQLIFPFEKPRKHQRQIIENIIQAFEVSDYVILQAPTGIGKSVIADAVSNYLESSYILTSQKMLQEQYFNDLSIPYVQGKNNYTCRKNGKLTCDVGMCTIVKNGQKEKFRCTDCPYYTARDATYKSPISNLNYSYFLSMCGNDLQVPRNLIVLDECHNLEDELIKSKSLEMTNRDLSFHEILISIPKSTDVNVLRNWLIGPCTDTLMSKFTNLQEQLDSYKEGKKNKYYYKLIKDHAYIKEVLKKIKAIESFPVSDIVAQNTLDGIQFRLLYGYNLFSEYIKPYGRKVLAMSATIFDKQLFCENIGVDPKDAVFINCPAVFPKENRPIHIDYAGKMTYTEKERTYPKLLEKVRTILDRHSNEKGIIHTVNYEIADYLYNGLQDSRLILPRGKERAEKIDQFLTSSVDEPYVLLSPSLTEGIDLKEDLSRFCIICKVPYLNIRDKWVEQRMQDNYEWYINNVIETMVQMTGRSIRSETDFAESYILDQTFDQFLRMNGHKFPKWWINSIV